MVAKWLRGWIINIKRSYVRRKTITSVCQVWKDTCFMNQLGFYYFVIKSFWTHRLRYFHDTLLPHWVQTYSHWVLIVTVEPVLNCRIQRWHQWSWKTAVKQWNWMPTLKIKKRRRRLRNLFLMVRAGSKCVLFISTSHCAWKVAVELFHYELFQWKGRCYFMLLTRDTQYIGEHIRCLV
jgi:hypothetical protein